MSPTEVGGPDPDLERKLAEAAQFLRGYAQAPSSEYVGKKIRGWANAVDEAARRVRESLTPGWICGACKAFNSDAKERLSACRCCGMARR